MQRPSRPNGEGRRTAHLHGSNRLADPGERFDRLTSIAAMAFHVPISALSLVDADRLLLRSTVGLDLSELPRNRSLCGHAILGAGSLIVEDALRDPRFEAIAWFSGEPPVRFYAGRRLDDGHGNVLGTLWVADHRPRGWAQSDQALLDGLADLIQLELAAGGLGADRQQEGDDSSRLDAILAAAVDGIITIDERGTIESANAAAERIFGYSEEELRGRNVSILMPSPFRENHDQYIRNYLDTGTSKIIGIGREVIASAKDGREFPLDLAIGEARTARGRIFIGIVRDITKRKQMDRMKSEFVSTVSHELRTPLTSIRGSLRLLDGSLGGQLDDQAKPLVRIALNNCERLVRLVNDILDIEKIEAGTKHYVMDEVDLGRLVADTVADNEGFGREHDVALSFSAQTEDVTVVADTDRIVQVVTNLVSNAVKFSPPEETVDVSLVAGEIGPRVEVTDHGPGIRTEFRSRIFGKFAQDDSSDTRGAEGTGLGLSICRGIVEDHGGLIGFRTEVGVGSTFHFELPRHPSSSQEAPRQIDHHDDTTDHGPTVLVCQSGNDVGHRLQVALQQAGFGCDITSSVAGAYDGLQSGRYAAMAVDRALVGIGGLEFLRELGDRQGTCRLPVVVLSANVDGGRAGAKGPGAQVLDWLTKPIDETRLVEVLETVRTSGGDSPLRVLHVEDDDDVGKVVKSMLHGHADVTHVHDLKTARTRLAADVYDLVLLDLDVPYGPHPEHPSRVSATTPTPVVLFSADGHQSVSNRPAPPG